MSKILAIATAVAVLTGIGAANAQESRRVTPAASHKVVKQDAMRKLNGSNTFNAYQAQPEGYDTSFRYYATPTSGG